MEFVAGVLALIRRNLTLVEYTGEFCGLAASKELHDAAILHLFRLGANYHCPMDLPDTTGLCWREGIYRCLGSYRSRVETSPLVSPLAPPQLIFASAGPVQLIFISVGPVQLIFVSAGLAQLIFAGPAQLVFVSAGYVQFCTTRAPPGAPGLVSGLWGDGLEPSPRA